VFVVLCVYLICIAVILFLPRMLPDPSVAPNDSPAGVLTEPVPLSGTAATVHHRLLITSINTQLLRQQYNGAKHITQTARCILVNA